MNLKSKIIDKSFYLKNNDETFNNNTIFLETLFEIPEIKELILSDVSKSGDYIISYNDSEGEELRMIAIAISFNEAIDIFNGVYGFEITGIRKV
jgi:hypothetical protein